MQGRTAKRVNAYGSSPPEESTHVRAVAIPDHATVR